MGVRTILIYKPYTMKNFIRLYVILFLLLIINETGIAQNVGINDDGSTPDNSAMLDVKSTSKGFLAPRLTTLQRTSISSPASGLMVYDTDLQLYYYYNGATWQTVGQVGGSSKWSDGTNSIYSNNNTNAVVYSSGQPYCIYGKVSVSGSGSGWGKDNVKAGIFGMSHSQSYHAGVYGWVEGTSVANEAAVLGAYSSAIFGGLGFTDGTNIWAGYFEGPVKITGGSPAAGKVLTSDASGGATWQSVSGTAWGLSGNAGTVDGTHFIGTTDDVPLNFRVNNTNAGKITSNGQTLFGYQAGNSNSSVYNTAIGFKALYTNSTADYNTAIGYKSLYENSSGTDNVGVGYLSLESNTSGSNNIALGSATLTKNTQGWYNVAIGYNALYHNSVAISNIAIGNASLFYNTTSGYNIAIGYDALYRQSFENGGTPYEGNNIAIGKKALYNNQPLDPAESSANIAIGTEALYSNSRAKNNIALGYNALYYNQASSRNIAIGYEALYNNVGWGLGSDDNIAIGYQSLYNNNPTTSTNGDHNIAIGASALKDNTIGSNCTAIGLNALTSNTEGIENTALGYNALPANTDGDYNIAVGVNVLNALSHGYENTVVGCYTLNGSVVNGVRNTAMGYNAIFSGDYSNSSAIGAYTSVTDHNQVRLGSSSVSSIGGNVGWTNLSDKRVKNDIKENVQGLAFIKLLRPVTFHYNVRKQNELLGVNDKEEWKGKYDIEKIAFSGFIAQEVEEAAKNAGYDFSGVDKSGSIMGLRYSEFTVPLVKAVQELNDKNMALEKDVENLKKEIEDMKKLLAK